MLNTTHLELTLLGGASLRVVRAAGDETEITLPTRKSLALIAYLALNGTTSRSEIAGLLWSEYTDAESRKNLRQDLYRLQSTAVGPWLEADRQRVGLRGLVKLDARLLREAAALGDLERVIALHKGPLLENFSLPGASEFDSWLEVERESLVCLHRQALSAHARDLENRGDRRGALQTLERLVRQDPLQEAAQRELMRLHWLLGERPQALERFVNLETLLRDEIGLEPSSQTLALKQQIRAVEPAAIPPMQNVTLELPFVGREDALTWLNAQSGLALLIGEPGIGKTRLALEFAGLRLTAGGSLLHLRGAERSRGTPYYPITNALLEHFERDPQSFDALRVAWREEVERLLPGHDGRTRESPSAEGRGWFLEGLAQSLAALVGASGCLVLDDLHYFDAQSLEILSHLTLRAPSLRMIGTLCPDGLVATNNPLGAIPSARLELRPLPKPDVMALLQRIAGPHSEALISCVSKVYDTTGGNPLFLLETLRDALNLGVLGVNDEGWITERQTRDTKASLTLSVRETINRRIERLGADLKRLLEAASLMTDDFTLEVVRRVVGLDSWTALEALEGAVKLQLLESSNRGYRFSQAVTKDALAQELGIDRTALLHLELARAFEETGGSAAQIVAHRNLAGQPLHAAQPWSQTAQMAHD